MRLLNVSTLLFKEFLGKVPNYAILSHRWASPEDEVSYADYLAGRKHETSGYAKIKQFCKVTRDAGLTHCWIDTCCIDKTSSAELSEAINSMWSWYQQASICFAYLSDVKGEKDFSNSRWFERGWTLQELLAPRSVKFLNQDWKPIGDRVSLASAISSRTKIDQNMLLGQKQLSYYSVAQRMSWAAHRKTTRPEDGAYCLLGIFGISMPLLYGEGHKAFRRLQEQILANGEDTSLFAWGQDMSITGPQPGVRSILAPSVEEFQYCGDMMTGFASQRILFETTNRGTLLSIHRSYNKQVFEELLEYGQTSVLVKNPAPVWLIVPLSCYKYIPGTLPNGRSTLKTFLYLACDHEKWRRIGIKTEDRPLAWLNHNGKRNGRHYPAYANDYIRLYIYDDWRPGSAQASISASELKVDQKPKVLHLQDIKE